MGVKAGSTCFQWSQPIVRHSPSSSRTLATAVSSPSSKRRRHRSDGMLVCRYFHKSDRFSLIDSSSTKLCKTRSYEHLNSRVRTMKRACSANLDAFSEEEFSRKIEELALRFELSDDDYDDERNNDFDSFRDSHGASISGSGNYESMTRESSSLEKQSSFFVDSLDPNWAEFQLQPPNWSVQGDMIPASIERKANSIDIPFSLRIIKRKLQWQDGFREAGESAYCSVKKAFSSMVFIIRELHSYSLQMRELLFTEDLQGIIGRVQKEMHASFVWLFQQVFSHTPTLMVYVMILLANFTVQSMGSQVAIAASASPTSYTATVESVVEIQDQKDHKFDSSSLKSYSLNSSSGKTASIGGNNGGGGKFRSISSGTDGSDERFDGSNQFRTVVPDGVSQLPSIGTEAESILGQVNREEELRLWNSIVDEASKMQSLDHETMQRFVSPIKAEIEPDDYEDYLKTELFYQAGLSQEPNNSLLLTNYAQFLYLVAHDYDRAEEYFKRAIGIEGADAESYSKYASFLWRAKKDLWAAEEIFLEAINADPSNSYYAANYAHFLWNTGGEDTCFPLDSLQDETHQL